LPVPEFAIKLLFGEMGKTLLLQGARVLPKRLTDAGFEFNFTNLGDAMKDVLGN
jgi:NAD dependent epimerase/dehydratase family enzyme